MTPFQFSQKRRKGGEGEGEGGSLTCNLLLLVSWLPNAPCRAPKLHLLRLAVAAHPTLHAAVGRTQALGLGGPPVRGGLGVDEPGAVGDGGWRGHGGTLGPEDGTKVPVGDCYEDDSEDQEQRKEPVCCRNVYYDAYNMHGHE